MAGHTNTPQVELDYFTPIQVIETNQFVLRDLEHHRALKQASYLLTHSLGSQ